MYNYKANVCTNVTEWYAVRQLCIPNAYTTMTAVSHDEIEAERLTKEANDLENKARQKKEAAKKAYEKAAHELEKKARDAGAGATGPGGFFKYP